MKPYETILSKISPTFFKLVQYKDYFDECFHSGLTDRYLKHSKVYIYYYSYKSRHIHYFFSNRGTYKYSHYPLNKKIISNRIILLTTRDMKPLLPSEYDLDEFIVNMVINKFAFENERMYYRVEYNIYESYKKVFIGLVGRDMYETIRENIR